LQLKKKKIINQGQIQTRDCFVFNCGQNAMHISKLIFTPMQNSNRKK